MPATSFLVGAALALVTGAVGASSGLDRDRAFYATVLIVVASYDCLFAAIGGRPSLLLWESTVFLLFAAAAVTGFRTSMWVVVAGLASHGFFDAVRGHVLDDPGIPSWWPSFCLMFDLTAGAFLAARIICDRKQ